MRLLFDINKYTHIAYAKQQKIGHYNFKIK